MNIQHQGFVTVLESQTLSPGVKGQNSGGEMGIKTGIASPEDKGSAAEEGGNVAALELLDDVIEAIIRQQTYPANDISQEKNGGD